MPIVPTQWVLSPTFEAFMENSKSYWISQNPLPEPTDFSGQPYPPAPPEGQSPEVSANPFTHCDPAGGIANALANMLNEFALNVAGPVDVLIGQYQQQTAQVNQQVQQPILKASNDILGLSGAKLTLKSISSGSAKKIPYQPPSKFFMLAPQYQQQVVSQIAVSETVQPVNKMTTEQLFGALGVPFVSSSADIEDSLLKKNIFLIDGLWVKEGNLDLTCAKKLGFLLGGQDLCTKMGPHLKKPAGAFTFVIVHRYTAQTSISQETCAPANEPLPTGDCYPSTDTTTTVEDVLAIDADIKAVLADFPFLDRSNLFFYVFWNEFPSPTLANTLQLQSWGLTNDEISLAFSVGTGSTLQACTIGQPQDVLSYLCGVSDSVLLKGPDGVDPRPSTSDIVTDILQKALTPPDSSDQTLPDNDNVAALVLGTINLRKTFGCLGPSQSDALEAGLQQAVGCIDAGFDAADQLLGSAQAAITQSGNGIQQLITLVQQYTNGFPSSYTKCLFPGQGFELSLPLPKSLLDAMRFVLNNQFAEIENSMNLFDNLFSGLLAGFCFSQSLVQGLIGSQAAQELGGAFAVIGEAAAQTGPQGQIITDQLSCSSFELPFPQFITDYLTCLLQIYQVVQRLIRGSINFSRTSFALLQSLRLQFGIANGQNLNTCSPQSVISAIAAIQAQLKGLT